jgi:hypothetical protein
MVLKACQQNTACHYGSEQLDPSRLPIKQPSQSNESSPDCSDHLRTAKKVNQYFHNLSTYCARVCIVFVIVCMVFSNVQCAVNI